VHYDQVAKELQAKELVPGVWAKAFAKAGGELERPRALYIKYRVAQLVEEADEKARQERRAAAGEAKQKGVLKVRAVAYAARENFRTVAYGVLAVVCGVLAILFGLAGISSLDRDAPDGIFGIIVGVVLLIFAFFSGFETYRCAKAAAKL
jgi:hypothetical protein